MKKTIRLTESDLTRIVKRIVNENESKLSGDFEDIGMPLEQIKSNLITPPHQVGFFISFSNISTI